MTRPARQQREKPQSKTQPPQHQERQPGRQAEMTPQPLTIRDNYKGSGKLKNKVAFISGADSGIGRAVAVHFAREGADVAIGYLEESEDAQETLRLVNQEGKSGLLVPGDCRSREFCREAIKHTLGAFGRLDILVNNLAVQYIEDEFENIDEAQLREVFETNIFAYMFLTQAALPYLPEGGVILNTSSVTAFRGHRKLMDYSATKGAIQSLTFSLAQSLAERRIRVNGVAPGPIWTPLIPASFSAEETAEFGSNTLMKRAGQPAEVAPAYVFLASEDASYITGQFIHVNGGSFIAA